MKDHRASGFAPITEISADTVSGAETSVAGGSQRELPSRAECSEFFQKILAPHHQRLQNLKSQVWSDVKRWGILPIVFFVLAWFLPTNYPAAAALAKLIGLASLVGLVWLLRIPQFMILSRSFKHDVLGQFVKFLSPTLNYQATVPFPDREFYGSGLFPERANINRIEDVLMGEFYNTSFMCGEVTTIDIKKTRDAKGRVKEQRIVRFRGLFFVIDFAKKFHGRTTVRSDQAEKYLGFLGRGLQRVGSGDELVELEDPEFEKHFVVQSTDQVEARFLLSTSFMRKLVELRAQVSPGLQVAFFDSKLIVAIPQTVNLFEISLRRPERWQEQALQLYDEIHRVLDIVWEFKMNDQLWRSESGQAG